VETRSFLAIASVERTGSTLLCSILRGTNLAGTPIEYLNIQTKNFERIRSECGQPKIKLTHQPIARVRKLTGRYPWRDISYFSSSSWRSYLSAIAQQHTTANGVFGVKMHWNQYKRHMLDMGVDASFWNVPVKWVRITREDELRQAISFVRAAQTESWNSNMATKADPVYDADAIAAALDRISDENSDWDVYFAQNNIVPLHITYEQLTRDMDATIKRVMSFIETPIDVVPEPQTKKQGDSINKEWAERFLAQYPEHTERTRMWQGLH
jgi:LPS sulfotransferase NodH